MNRLRSIAFVIEILSLIGIIVGNSNAAEIVEFPSDTEDYSYAYGGYTYHMANLKTDVPYTAVDWYIGDWQWQESDMGDGVTTTASFCPFGKIPGIIKGKWYTITAKAWFMVDGEGSYDIESYSVRMFESKSISGVRQPIPWEKPKVTGAYGYVELTRHYHNGQNIVRDGYASAYNNTDHLCSGSFTFRHTQFKKMTMESLLRPGGKENIPDLTEILLLNNRADRTVVITLLLCSIFPSPAEI